VIKRLSLLFMLNIGVNCVERRYIYFSTARKSSEEADTGTLPPLTLRGNAIISSTPSIRLCRRPPVLVGFRNACRGL
jgi:hypothetical protein